MAKARNQIRGSQHPLARLDESSVSEILALVERRNQLKRALHALTNDAIAARFGVHSRTIEKIIHGESWAHVGTGDYSDPFASRRAA
jgi:DNA-directed RNA polymerase specialized sigma24 family protein